MSLQARVRHVAVRGGVAPGASDAPDGCKRRAFRKATALPSMLMFPGMRLAIPGLVTDMSASGARMTFPQPLHPQYANMEHLPARCTLVLRMDRVQIEGQIMWRRHGGIGIKFLSPPRPMNSAKR